MGHIKVLTEQVASQIAAGEVIERPASIVRELLDNSIDAGSTRITIRIEAGGRHLIRIGDNGAGMGRDDRSRRAEDPAHREVDSAGVDGERLAERDQRQRQHGGRADVQ